MPPGSCRSMPLPISLLVLVLFLTACDGDSTGVDLVEHIEVSSTSEQITEGESALFVGVAKNDRGQPLQNRQLTWAVDPSSLAEVEVGSDHGTAMVRALRAGKGTVNAAVDGVWGEAELTIRPLSPTEIQVSRFGPHLIQVSWATEGKGSTSFRVERRAEPEADWKVRGEVGAQARSLQDEVGSLNGVIRYRVKACEGPANCSDPSSVQEIGIWDPLRVQILPSNLTLASGESYSVQVEVTGGDLRETPILACQTSNPDVVWVAEEADRCRVTGGGTGNATVTATVTRGNAQSSAGMTISVR